MRIKGQSNHLSAMQIVVDDAEDNWRLEYLSNIKSAEEPSSKQKKKRGTEVIQDSRTLDDGSSVKRCPYINCGKEVVIEKNKDNFSKHLHTHSTDRVCWMCEKTLSTCDSLGRHMLTHSGERPHVCPECDAAFTVHSNMERHRDVQHKNRNPHSPSTENAAAGEPNKPSRAAHRMPAPSDYSNHSPPNFLQADNDGPLDLSTKTQPSKEASNKVNLWSSVDRRPMKSSHRHHPYANVSQNFSLVSQKVFYHYPDYHLRVLQTLQN